MVNFRKLRESLHRDRDEGMALIGTWSTGEPSQPVVGESRHVGQLQAVSRSLGGGATGERMTVAVLVPEPSNPFDVHAIRVDVGGAPVGYLPREDAPAYAEVLGPLAHQRMLLQVPARVWWGQDGGHEFYASVTLDLPAATLLFPANEPPPGAAVLPEGWSAQVSGTEVHGDALGRLLQGRGQTLVYVTLHRQSDVSAKGRIRIDVDGQPIGQLSPAASKHLLPVVQYAEDRGVPLSARAVVTGNRLSAQVEVWATKASQLSEDWLAGLAASRSAPMAGAPAARKVLGVPGVGDEACHDTHAWPAPIASDTA